MVLINISFFLKIDEKIETESTQQSKPESIDEPPEVEQTDKSVGKKVEKIEESGRIERTSTNQSNLSSLGTKPAARKRRWGGTSSAVGESKISGGISSDRLKELIPD